MTLYSLRPHFACVAFMCMASCVQAQLVFNPTNQHYYERISNTITWDTASANATSNGGYLATLTSQEENDFIVTSYGGSNISGFHIGGTQPAGSQEPGGGWQWVTGETWSYTNWNGGEPNDGAGVFPLENRLQYAWNAGNGTWNDILNTLADGNTRGYIVEYNQAPVPAPSALAAFVIGAVPGAAVLLRRRRKA